MKLEIADYQQACINDIWAPVKGFEDFYEAHYRGIIRNKLTKHVLRGGKVKAGYITVALLGKSHSVHRIIAKTFLTDPEKEMVNHKDGIKNNNHIANLEWATRSENERHAYDTKLKSAPRPSFGLIQKNLSGEVVRVYATTIEAEKDGFYSGCIAQVCNGKRLTHAGFKWEYINSKNK